MKQPRKPTLVQKKLIAAAGLDPDEWMVKLEDKLYLQLVDRGIEQRKKVTINKQAKQIVEAP